MSGIEAAGWLMLGGVIVLVLAWAIVFGPSLAVRWWRRRMGR